MRYRVQFEAVVTREVDVPNDFTWTEAYNFVRDQLGWQDLALSAAARLEIDTGRVLHFNKVPDAE
jgi:hypothetical protein